MLHLISQLRISAGLCKPWSSWTGDRSLCALGCKSEVEHHRICVGMDPPCFCWCPPVRGSPNWPVDRSSSCIYYFSWKSSPMPILVLSNQTRSSKSLNCWEKLTGEGRELWDFSGPSGPRRTVEQIAGPVPEDSVGHSEGPCFVFLTSCKKLTSCKNSGCFRKPHTALLLLNECEMAFEDRRWHAQTYPANEGTNLGAVGSRPARNWA